MNAILANSRHNNGIDGISGMLWCDGTRFAQVLEGPLESVDQAMSRIGVDSRHHDIAILIDEPADERLFADWSMAYAPAGRLPDHLRARISRLGARDDAAIASFMDLILPPERY